MRLTMSIGFNYKYSQTVTHSIHKSHFPHNLSCKGYPIVLGDTEKVYCYLLQILKNLNYSICSPRAYMSNLQMQNDFPNKTDH